MEATANFLLSKIALRPEVGIICGSGLTKLSDNLTDTQTFPYETIPGFPRTTVVGHAGELVFGKIGNTNCVAMKGRFHFYEGHNMETVTFPVRVMRLLGVKLLIVTNAAGGLNPAFNVGDIMVMQDHFGAPCIAGNHPLRGLNNDALGPRFPAMSDAYDPELQSIFLQCARDLGIMDRVRPDGAYMMVSGPSYESMAESKFLRQIGGDAVGMSTVPEVIVARHCGMQVLGLSFITNKVVTTREPNQVHASHAEVLEAADKAGPLLVNLVKAFVEHTTLRAYLNALPEFEYKPVKAAAHAHTPSPPPAGGLLPAQPQITPDSGNSNNELFLLSLLLFVGAGFLYARAKGTR